MTSQNLPDLPDVELLSEAQREPEPTQADAELEPEPSDVEVAVRESSRAVPGGRAQLRALTIREARYGPLSAKMQTAGTLWVTSG